MVVTFKSDKTPSPDDKLRKKIINNGGSTSNESGRKKWVTISLRITEDLLEEITEKTSERIGISRNAWMLEALQEKLKKEIEK